LTDRTGSPQRDARPGFAERVRLQLQARYPGMTATAEEARFGVRMVAAGIDVTLPLTPLWSACQREPARVPALIAEFARDAEARLVPGAGEQPLDLGGLLWCVRTRGYLAELSRAGELLSRELAGDLVAFVAQVLPGTVMRGVPRAEWRGQDVHDAAVGSAATANTVSRFARLAARIRTADRAPRDGWRLSGDVLFQGSVLTSPPLLRALAERAGGRVLLGVPDRAVVLAQPAAAPSADGFPARVARAHQEAANPCSAEVLIGDSTGLEVLEAPSRRQRGLALLAWLRD
jgi:hypothetical protein